MTGQLYPPPPWRLAERRALWRHWLRDPIDGLADLLPHHAMRLLPTQAASNLGGWMGRRSGARRQAASDRARALLRMLRPQHDAAAIEALVGDHWEYIGRSFAEFAALDRLWAEGRIDVEGAAPLEAIRAAGRPLIVAGLHVGNWEVVHAGLSGLGIRFSGIYQRLPNRFRMAIADAARNRIRIAGGPGVALAPTLGAVFEAHRLLETRKSALLYYVDEFWEGRVHAPLLGRAMRLDGNAMRAARLAAATGAALVPAYALRVGRQARFRLVFLPEVPIGPPGRGRAGIREDLAALEAAIEPVVRAHPEQWMMLHAFRPDGG